LATLAGTPSPIIFPDVSLNWNSVTGPYFGQVILAVLPISIMKLRLKKNGVGDLKWTEWAPNSVHYVDGEITALEHMTPLKYAGT
jgi:hypothetical protein